MVPGVESFKLDILHGQILFMSLRRQSLVPFRRRIVAILYPSVSIVGLVRPSDN